MKVNHHIITLRKREQKTTKTKKEITHLALKMNLVRPQLETWIEIKSSASVYLAGYSEEELIGHVIEA